MNQRIKMAAARRRYRLNGHGKTLDVWTNPEGVPAHVLQELADRERMASPERAALAARIKENLSLSRAHAAGRPLKFQPSMSLQSWVESIRNDTADGTQVLNSTTETIMVPDFTVPANYMLRGRALRYILYGDVSTVVTTPGTMTFRTRWGGVAGTLMAASAAVVPKVTVSTTLSYRLEWEIVSRADPSGAAAVFTMGFVLFNNALADGSQFANLVIPQSAPASVNLATNAANALSSTITFSVSTATTQLTNHIAILQSQN